MSKELYVRREDNTKRVIYLVKELLKEGKELNVVSSNIGAEVVSKVCNALQNMNYVTITDIHTQTEVKNEKRKITLSIKVEKTKEFDVLYEENVKRRQEMLEQREKTRGETNN